MGERVKEKSTGKMEIPANELAAGQECRCESREMKSNFHFAIDLQVQENDGKRAKIQENPRVLLWW